MGKIGFVFSGQGAQVVGMGQDLAEAYPEAQAIFNRADKSLGYRVSEMCFNGPEADLNLTVNTQPALVTVCTAIGAVLKSAGIEPDYSAGLSLGEYSALVHNGSIAFEDALLLVRRRGELMQAAVPLGQGTMAAIIGLERQALEVVLEEARAEGIVEGANYNCPGQIVIGGQVEAVERAMALAETKGAKMAVKLSVSAPFHTSMLAPAAEALVPLLEATAIQAPVKPVYANVDAQCHEANQIREKLSLQVKSPVWWEDIVVDMMAQGVDTFVEIGPGKVLSGFIKKINRKVTIYQAADVASIEGVIQQLKA